eukprot:4504176-Pleurochrysis_carterae.AAC.1
MMTETEMPDQDEVQPNDQADDSLEVESDAEVARFVAENEPKGSSGPSKEKADELLMVKKRIEEGLKCSFSVLEVPANGSC